MFQSLVILFVLFALPVQPARGGSVDIEYKTAGLVLISETPDEMPGSPAIKDEHASGQSDPVKREAQGTLQSNSEVMAMEIRIRFLSLFSFLLMIALAITLIYYRKQNKSLRDQYDRSTDLLQSLGIDINLNQSASEDPGGVIERNRPDFQSEKLYEKIKPLFTEKKIYRDPDLSLGKVAEMAGSNRRYVSDSIYKTTSLKFNDYINFYRVNESKELLTDGDYSLSDIQFMCGFNSRTTFYKAFKKRTGVTPAQFKKSAGKRS